MRACLERRMSRRVLGRSCLASLVLIIDIRNHRGHGRLELTHRAPPSKRERRTSGSSYPLTIRLERSVRNEQTPHMRLRASKLKYTNQRHVLPRRLSLQWCRQIDPRLFLHVKIHSVQLVDLQPCAVRTWVSVHPRVMTWACTQKLKIPERLCAPGSQITRRINRSGDRRPCDSLADSGSSNP